MPRRTALSLAAAALGRQGGRTRPPPPMRKGDYGELSSTARAHGTSPQALLQRRRVKAGCCAQCGRKRERHTWYCDACASQYRSWRQKWIAARREQGICRCGRDLEGNRARCPTCRDRERRGRAATTR